jgi:2-C-methyl-D-erythritol 4-phosphate cytidylyltransferase
MGAALRKPFLTLEGTPVLVYAVQALAEAPSVKRIVVVVHPDDEKRAEEILRGPRRPPQLEAIVPGGAERIDSVRVGALWPCCGIDKILVHDGARPLVRPAEVEEVIQAARVHGAALLALPVLDTVKRSKDGKFAGGDARARVRCGRRRPRRCSRRSASASCSRAPSATASDRPTTRRCGSATSGPSRSCAARPRT